MPKGQKPVFQAMTHNTFCKFKCPFRYIRFHYYPSHFTLPASPRGWIWERRAACSRKARRHRRHTAQYRRQKYHPLGQIGDITHRIGLCRRPLHFIIKAQIRKPFHISDLASQRGLAALPWAVDQHHRRIGELLHNPGLKMSGV